MNASAGQSRVNKFIRDQATAANLDFIISWILINELICFLTSQLIPSSAGVLKGEEDLSAFFQTFLLKKGGGGFQR